MQLVSCTGKALMPAARDEAGDDYDRRALATRLTNWQWQQAVKAESRRPYPTMPPEACRDCFASLAM